MSVFTRTQFKRDFYVPNEILLFIEIKEADYLSYNDEVWAKQIIDATNDMLDAFVESNAAPDPRSLLNDLPPLSSFKLDFNPEQFILYDDEAENNSKRITQSILLFDSGSNQPDTSSNMKKFYAVLPTILSPDPGPLEADKHLAYYVSYWFYNREAILRQYFEISEDQVEDDDEWDWRNSKANFWIQSTTPNFYMSTSGASAAEGGPGSRPVPYPRPYLPWPRFVPASVPSGFQPRNSLNWDEFRKAHFERNHPDRKTVKVIILDTAYRMEVDASGNKIDRLTERLQHWDTQGNVLATNLLNLQSAGSPGSLTVHDFVGQRHVPPPPAGGNNPRVAMHCYDMRDHGTFIASVINELAPNAEIHLLRALDDSGVSTLTILLSALNHVLTIQQNNPGTPMVINLSFVIDLDSDKTIELDKYRDDHAADPLDQDDIDELVDALVLPIQMLLDLQDLHENAFIVGAAGNDGLYKIDWQNDPCANDNPSDDRFPPTKYPAAFNSVIGVGALNSYERPAPYSNEPNNRPSQGIRAFGGDPLWDRGDASGVTNYDSGFLSLYMADEIPFDPDNLGSGEQNSSGYAMWCGTSFASALVSGTIAMLFAADLLPDDILNDVQTISRNQRTEPRYLPIVPTYIP